MVRKDGSLRPWSEFKREALMVVGESNRYLKTEYNTVVSGAQMSRMWQEIQRDKHIFPFVQFDVVKDGRTSDICSPLDKLIFEVDSPVLAYYFPPNHFNCRTRVRKLRNGVPSKNYTLPDIPTEFKNNAGMCPPAYKKLLSNDSDKKPIRKECGEIFTEENRYIKNTPTKLLSDLDYYRDENILVSSKAKKHTKSEIERPRVEDEYKNRIIVAKVLQRHFELKTTVLPEIKPSHWAYDYHFEGVKEYGKVPDFKIGDDFWEMESYEGKYKKSKLWHMIKEGTIQADNVALKLNHFLSFEQIDNQMKELIKNKYDKMPLSVIMVYPNGKIAYQFYKKKDTN